MKARCKKEISFAKPPIYFVVSGFNLLKNAKNIVLGRLITKNKNVITTSDTVKRRFFRKILSKLGSALFKFLPKDHVLNIINELNMIMMIVGISEYKHISTTSHIFDNLNEGE